MDMNIIVSAAPFRNAANFEAVNESILQRFQNPLVRKVRWFAQSCNTITDVNTIFI